MRERPVPAAAPLIRRPRPARMLSVTSPAAPRSPSTRIVLFVLLLAALWGGNVVAIKVSLASLPPFALAGLRFGLALPLIAAWAALRGISLAPARGELVRLLPFGLLFFVQIACINWGTALTRAGRAAVLVNSYPVFVGVLAHFMIPGDRLSRLKAAGLGVALAGIVAVFWESLSGGGGDPVGDALSLASGVLLALLVVLINRLAQRTPPARLVFYEMLVGAPLFLLCSALLERGGPGGLTAAGLAGVLYQALVVATFCFLAWAELLKRYSPSRLSVLFFTTPLWGVAFSYLLLGEKITGGLVFGAALVAVGVYLVHRS